MSSKLMDLTLGTEMLSKSEIENELSKKQNKLSAGAGINIADGTISCTYQPPQDVVNNSVFIAELAKKQGKLTPGSGVKIENDVISLISNPSIEDPTQKPTILDLAAIECVEAYWKESEGNFYSNSSMHETDKITPAKNVVYIDLNTGKSKVLKSDGTGFKDFAFVTPKYVELLLGSICQYLYQAQDTLGQIVR